MLALLLARLFAVFVTGPPHAEIISAGFADSVDPALAARAARGQAFDWVSWGLTLVPGVLVIALAAPATDAAVGGGRIVSETACGRQRLPRLSAQQQKRTFGFGTADALFNICAKEALE